MAGPRIGIDHTPLRLGAVDALIDLLANRRIEPAVAFGKAAEPQIAVSPGYSRCGHLRQVQFGRGAPANAAGDRRIVSAAEDAARILPGKDHVDAGCPVAMLAKGAY